MGQIAKAVALEVRQFARTATRAILFRFPCEADREDLEQEAAIGILRALGKLDDARPEAERRSFLICAGRRAAIDALRHRKRHARDVLGFVPVEESVDWNGAAFVGCRDGVPSTDPWGEFASADDPDGAFVTAEIAARIVDVLELAESRMTPGQRAIFRARVYGEIVPEQFAHVSQSGVRDLAARARACVNAASRDLGCVDLIGPVECVDLLAI